MAPTNAHSARRGDTGSVRPYRNANTNAGVNCTRPAALRDAHRARDLRRRPAHFERARPPTNAPAGPSLASRMTYGNSRGGTTRPRPQNGRRLQDRITRADENVVGGTGGGHRATMNPQVNNRAQEQNTRAAPPATNNSDVDIDIDIEMDNITFDNSQLNTNPTNFSQASMFCGSQPTQFADAPIPLSPPTGPVQTVKHAHPIRIINQPINLDVDEQEGKHTHERPINNYRGKDPIKQLVQNKKLQAVLAGKKVPAERKKHRDERMELRCGEKTVMK